MNQFTRVPGLLDDATFQARMEQMQEQIKNVRVDPERQRAMGFVERLSTEYLNQPTRAVLGAGARLAPGPLGLTAGALLSSTATPPDTSRDDRSSFRAGRLTDLMTPGAGDSDNAAQAKLTLRQLLLGPIAGALGEGSPIASLGRLTAEEGREEAEAKAVAAAEDEAVLRRKAGVREQLRNLSDAEAQALGLPVAPGGTPQAVAAEGEERDKGVVAGAAEERKAAAAAVLDPAQHPTQTVWLDAGRRAILGATTTLTLGAKLLPIMFEMATAEKYAKGPGREWIESFEKTIAKMVPPDAARNQEFVAQAASGVGSFLGFMIAAYGLGAMGASRLAIGGFGGAVGASGGYLDAEEYNATNTQKLISFVANGALGLTEMLPILNTFSRAQAATGNAVTRALSNVAVTSLEEMIQELTQTIGEDAYAKLTYDTSRDMSLQKYLRTAAVSALTGGLGGGISSAIVQAAEASRDTLTAPQQEPAAKPREPGQPDPVVESLQTQIDELPGMLAAETDMDAEDLFDIRVPQLTPVDEADIRELANEADAALPPEVAQAVDDFVGHPAGAIDEGREGSGIMRAERLEAIARGEAPKAARQMEEAFDPIRERLRELVGDTIRLFRVQREINPDRRVVGMPEDGQRFALSWTSNPDFARDLAGLQNRRLLIPESEIVRMEREFEENGRVDVAPGRWLERVTETIRGEPVTYIAIMGADGMVTDTDSVRSYAEDLNEWRREDMASDDARASDIVAADIDLYDVMWITDRAGQSEFIVQNSPENPKLYLPSTGERPNTGLVHRRGGTIPVDADGMFRITHESDEALAVIDPRKRGSKGLGRGAEGARLGPQGNPDPDVVDRSYFGVGDPDFRRPPGEMRLDTDPYHGESLGHIRHTVAVDPAVIYNALEDPLRLWSKVPTDIGSARRLTRFERLVRDAGFKGLYYESGPTGKVAMMFEPTTPERVVDKRYNLPVEEIAEPADFEAPTAETFRDKGGWAILTATREAVGDFTAPENVAANTKLRNTLRRRGIRFQEVDGTYQGVDQGKSLLIFAPEAVARELGAKFGQESVLTRRGLEFTDGSGRIVPAVTEETVIGDAARKQDFFSVLPSGEAFSVGLDFGGEVDFLASMADRSPAELIDAVLLDPAELEPLPGLTTGKPIERVVKAARAYAEWAGLPVRRQARYVIADPDRGARIAAAYEAMEHAPNDPAVARAYQAMIDETLAQYQFVKASGVVVEAIEPGQPDPYPGGPKEVLADLERGHLWFFPTDQGFGTLTEIGDNPLLAPTDEFIGDRQLLANDVFRIVHDFFGHGIEGSGFGARGEENAWQSHMRLYSEAALPAVTSETRGQNSWVNFGPFGEANRANQRDTVYADQKTGIMPEWTWREGVEDDQDADDPDIFAMAAVKPRRSRADRLMDEIPGLKGIAKYLTPDEQEKLRNNTAQKLVRVFEKLPDPKEMAAVAISGRAKRGWYARSGKALLDIFGIEDAPRFAALLAALSPQVSVESNAVNALKVWTAWINQGRPTDARSIRSILAFNVQGDKGEKSVLAAWVPNSIEALSNPDPATIELSGPKVSSFMLNLRGVVNEVTNDAWMANYANVDQTLFRGSNTKHRRAGDARKNVMRKTPGYVAMSVAVRRAAEVATRLTGDTWTPAEIQETVWSWAKTLYEKSSASLPAEELLAVGGLTSEEISATPDFAALFATGVYRTVLQKGGYDVDQIAAGSERADAGDVSGGDPLSAEGTGLAQDAFERHLRRAARRLDALRERRDEAEAETRAEARAETPDLNEDVGAQPEEFESLMDADGMFAARTRAPFTGERRRPAGGVPGRAGAAEQDLSLVRLGRNLAKLMALTHRQGRLTIKGSNVMGQFSRRTGVVRTRSVGDFPSLVHEAGHALHMAGNSIVTDFVTRHRTMLKKVADNLYGGDTNLLNEERHVAEGFAEFFRVYMLNRTYVDGHWPQLGSDLDMILETHAPELATGLKALKLQYDRVLNMPSAQSVRNMVVPGVVEPAWKANVDDIKERGFGTWMHEVIRGRMAQAVNKWVPLNELVANTLNIGERNQGVPLDLKVADDPRKMIALAANAAGRAMVQVMDGVMPHRSVEPATRSLRDALVISQGARPGDNLSAIDDNRSADFDAYLVALRAVDEYRRMDEGKVEREPLDPRMVTRDDLVQAIADYEAQYPEFVEAAEIVNEVGMALWEKGYAAGLMTKEVYEDGLDRNFYAPLLRDLSDKRDELGSSGVTSATALVQRYKGSDRLVVSPLTMLMQKTFALEQAIAKNEVKRMLAQLADRAGTAGAMIERIPAHKLIGQQLSVKEAARALVKDDTLSAADAQDLMTLLDASIEEGNIIRYFRTVQASTGGENIIFFWENGKLAALQLADGEIGRDVVELLDGIGQENMQFATELLAKSSQIFRSAIISWPDYILVNFIRDQFQTFILSDQGFIPFVTGLRGVGDELRQGQWAKQYNASMGMMGGMQVSALHEARVDRDLNALRKKGYLPQAFADGPLRGIARVTEVSETGSRMGLYKNAFLRGKADGLTDWEAAMEAAYISTDIMNFGMHGSRMLLVRRTIPFLNSQIVGFYKMMRTLGGDEVRQRRGLRFVLQSYFKDINNLPLSRTEKAALKTGRRAWFKMVSLALLSTALHFAFEDDEDYQETSEYLRATGWVIPMGDGRIFYIPKPFELALLANFTERAFEHASGDQEAKWRFMRGLGLTMIPPHSPPAIALGYELATNRDLFSGRDITPREMQGLAPHLRYNHFTSEFAKQIAGLGLPGLDSPVVVDHILNSMGASAYRDLTTLYNGLDPNRPSMGVTDAPIARRFVRDVHRGAASARDFWEQASTTNGALAQAENSYKMFVDEGREAAAAEYLQTLDDDQKAFALLNTHFEAEAKRLHPFYRARQLNTVISGLRREMVSDLPVEDTTVEDQPGEIVLTARKKAQLDDALSELARREMRNTLIYMRAPGWAGKKPMDTEHTLGLIEAIDPEMSAELDRRIRKKKVYSAEAVMEYWPEVQDRLLSDGQDAFLNDVVTVAKATSL